jgi:hypothetical protein
MMNLIRKLFGTCDRVEAAQERVAVAFEGLAADVEALRTAFRDRLGVAELPALPALPAPAAVSGLPQAATAAGASAVEEPAKRGRKATHAA